MVSVTDFMPYFYVPAPRGFRSEDIDSFVNELNVRWGHLPTDIPSFTISSQSSVGGVISIELVQKRSLWGYLGDDFALFMKVTVTQPRNVPRVRDEW
jgi:DNA polymerase delta subunit 1